ncbi:DUF1630-domain-containing protein [Sparassis crispa]|uniref:DUF1630-domain-containing protein n=1 Tax=Sparassis crispa TaxID=139825 RepID=A0A401H1A9_9APHY|nr:DUF1630-domain-containing protein [Sparassis crispa]GBE88217.1 DUF1630-domain-containing protein [Sparassis crispa]
MFEEAESDIGLVNLSRSSFSPPFASPLKSPSLPNVNFTVEASSPLERPAIARSNTQPKFEQCNVNHGSLLMEPSKVAGLRRWISALVVGKTVFLDFDLEVGPKIRNVYPPLGFTLSEEENIAFSSFPDAPHTEEGSQIHSFRIRAHESLEGVLSHQRPVTEDGFIYGYSHFTQRKDNTSKRGYQQRSLVLLSHLPYPSLFYALLTKLGPSFLAHGGSVLEVACHNIAKWPNPCPDATLELGFLGAVLQVELPHSIDTQQLPITRSTVRQSVEMILPSLSPAEPPIISLYEASLQHLWSIWECLILCEPILVYAPSPAMTSQAIWWLRDLLRPIPLAGDFRPFFTIHDADHTVLVNPRPPQAGLLLGVTNPFFDRACKHWPHVLSLGRLPPKKSGTGKDSREDTAIGPSPGWTSRTHKRYISRDRALLQQVQDACRGSDISKRRASAMLHQHFSSRTAAFLVPLQRYLQTLIPTPSESARALARFPAFAPMSIPDINVPASPVSSTSTSPSPTPSTSPSPSPAPSTLSSAVTPTPYHTTPTANVHITTNTHAAPREVPLRLKPFSERAFLASLSAHGATKPLPFKSSGKAREFYKRWLRSPAFGVWIARQEEIVQRVLNGKGG